MDSVIVALVAIAAAAFQSILLFRATVNATAQVRQDYLDVLINQARSFELTLEHIRQTQHVQGVPLQLALVQHETQREAALADAKHQYELGRMDLEMRRGLNGAAKRPPVAPQAAMGD